MPAVFRERATLGVFWAGPADPPARHLHTNLREPPHTPPSSCPLLLLLLAFNITCRLIIHGQLLGLVQ